MNERLEKYISGYLDPTKWQSADIKGDPQLSGLRVAIASALKQVSASAAVWDLGMGSGLLAVHLLKLTEFRQGEQIYCGVDLVVTQEPVRISGIDTGLISKQRARYFSFSDLFEQKSLQGDALAVLRNTLHELDLVTFARILKVLVSPGPKRLFVIIQDISNLATAELGNAPWPVEEIEELLVALGFSVSLNVPDESRSETPWFTIVCDRAAVRDSDTLEILARLVAIRRRQKAALEKLGISLLSEARCGAETARLALLKIQNDLFAIAAQLSAADDELSKLTSMALCGRPDGLVSVSWTEIIHAVDSYLADEALRSHTWDVVIGVARGGLPIAVAFAHRLPSAHLGAVVKRYSKVDPAPFFVFDAETYVRSEREKIMDGLVIPNTQGRISKVLVVDDVTTFGNTLASAEAQLRMVLGSSVSIDFFTYACDRARLSVSRPEIARRLTSHREVDNKKHWLVFPWESSGPTTEPRV